MSVYEKNMTAQFYLTALQPCPYLPGREERKIFTTLSGEQAGQVNHGLSLMGFRRSQNVAYRPACPGCGACVSMRVPIDAFAPSRGQRRVARRNADLTRSIVEAVATDEQHDLFRRYLDARHADGGMGEMTSLDFSAMIERSPVTTRVVELRAGRGGELVGACLTDVTADGLSMVYSFYDPAEKARSLGAFMILDHVEIAREAGLPHVYLGYWVPGSRKMAYKEGFRPFEVFIRGAWRRVEDGEQARELLGGLQAP